MNMNGIESHQVIFICSDSDNSSLEVLTGDAILYSIFVIIHIWHI